MERRKRVASVIIPDRAAQTHGPTYSLLQSTSIARRPLEMSGQCRDARWTRGRSRPSSFPPVPAEPRAQLRSPKRCLQPSATQKLTETRAARRASGCHHLTHGIFRRKRKRRLCMNFHRKWRPIRLNMEEAAGGRDVLASGPVFWVGSCPPGGHSGVALSLSSGSLRIHFSGHLPPL